MLRFEMRLAFRHLVSGGGQTALTVGAVAVAVTVVLFIQALISGVQRGLTANLVDPLPHVTIRAREPRPQTLAEVGALPASVLPITRRQAVVQRRSGIQDWKALERQAALFPAARTVAPVVLGSAFLVRGEKRVAVTVTGSDPREQEGITPLREDLIAGRWPDIGPRDIVIGYKLAQDNGIILGDRVRLQAAEGGLATFLVAGLFGSGDFSSDGASVYMTLAAAQGLFETGGAVTAVLLKLTDPFRADEVADLVKASLGYDTGSWSRDAGGFLTALQAQGYSSLLISLCALLAAAFAIASVLIISVLQKSRQIGILKSMGARDRQILAVFTLEGLGIAVAGSLFGCLAGYGLLRAVGSVTQTTPTGREELLFPIVYAPGLFLGAAAASVGITLLAAAIPARRAARLNPVDAIRGG